MSDEFMESSDREREDDASHLARKLPDQVSGLRAMTKAFGEAIANTGVTHHALADLDERKQSHEPNAFE